MFKKLIFMFFCLPALSLSAQTTRALKLFAAAGYTDPDDRLILIDSLGNYARISLQNGPNLTPGAGFRWSRHENIKNEVELAEFYTGRKLPGLVVGKNGSLGAANFPKKEFRIRVRHGISFQAKDSDKRKVWFSIGGGYSLFYQTLTLEPLPENFYKVVRSLSGIGFDINPAFHGRLSPDWQIELSAPVFLSYLGFRKSRFYNPALTERQQKNGSFDLDIGVSEAWLRLGILYDFQKKNPETE